MRVFLTIFAFLLSFSTSAFAEDPSPLRQLMTGDDSRGWEAVGRLNIGRSGMCTGALIAPDLVLTAAHCVYDKHTHRMVDATQIEFLAGLRNGRASAYRWVESAMVHPDYFYDPDGRPQMRNDIALLRLVQPIRNGSIVPFETYDRPSKGDEVGVVSYAHDRMETPAFQESCFVLARQSGTLVMSCDVDFGSSGAPVFTIVDGIPKIVSVVSAKAELDTRRVAIGASLDGALPELLLAMQNDLRPPTPEGPVIRRIGQGRAQQGSGAKFVRP
ncbi:trypsin-like serine peptidase [Pseudohalocynthiibacter aestuariivivens]|jgi:protease YdgD|uniref:Trypsin-like serine peptidase n=1 Tax=Pseudohalocynthiibacter aestuariivivens TaxID=1591409 RepID=A0ABV5JBH5_9RHOB|nr:MULTISPECIES: trypsin-like serine protease [Pseudohalocynthiibacter]MBS9715649.1 trypsin-like serine protease [Pseudohalocynthiibacter aestuariivivens]MCK0101262.1 trypsin-like serine protease [Pseudohalocynthiibacter sp. F2068]